MCQYGVTWIESDSTIGHNGKCVYLPIPALRDLLPDHMITQIASDVLDTKYYWFIHKYSGRVDMHKILISDVQKRDAAQCIHAILSGNVVRRQLKKARNDASRITAVIHGAQTRRNSDLRSNSCN